VNRTARNYKAMAEQDERSQPTGQVVLYGVLADMRGKPVVTSAMSPDAARRVARELLEAARQAEQATGQGLTDAERARRRVERMMPRLRHMALEAIKETQQ